MPFCKAVLRWLVQGRFRTLRTWRLPNRMFVVERLTTKGENKKPQERSHTLVEGRVNRYDQTRWPGNLPPGWTLASLESTNYVPVTMHLLLYACFCSPEPYKKPILGSAGRASPPSWLKCPQVPMYPDNKPNPLADCILWSRFGHWVGGSPSRGKVLTENFSITVVKLVMKWQQK